MKTYDMLTELKRAVDDEDIINDRCEHDNIHDPDEYCDVCFILSVHELAEGFSADEFEREAYLNWKENIIRLYDKL